MLCRDRRSRHTLSLHRCVPLPAPSQDRRSGATCARPARRCQELDSRAISDCHICSTAQACIPAPRRFGVGSPLVTSPTHEPLSFWAFFGVWFVTNDLIFTAFHTCFHMWPWLYRLVHKEHHTWKAPFSWMSHAMSLYELAANGVAVMFWPLFHSLVLGRPTAIELVWFVQCFSQLIGCIEHSGYDAIPPLVLPMNLWFPSIFSNTKHHDDHHRAFNGNFGGYLCVWDNMMGTALKLDAV
jgi:sterol desaturase/sphingolipid hydroxylase (fatty acid hydroxylase superfamily)